MCAGCTSILLFKSINFDEQIEYDPNPAPNKTAFESRTDNKHVP